MSGKDYNTRKLFNLCGGPTPAPVSGPKGGTDIVTPLELHGCAGLNACKGHDRFGTNDCAGMGYCSTTTHVCHTLNNCRGQGGCGLYGSAEEQCQPGDNVCAFQGSCATPIQEERFSTLGPNAGKSVWLLDVNNVYVSAFNNDFDPLQYLRGLPHEHIVQMHLAGHRNLGNFVIDTHDQPVLDRVWELFSLAWELTGGTSLLLEWDSDIPEFDEYHDELLKARGYMQGFIGYEKHAIQAAATAEMVSNPVSFMVSDAGDKFGK